MGQRSVELGADKQWFFEAPEKRKFGDSK